VFRVWVSESPLSGSGFEVSCFVFRVWGFGFQVSGVGFEILN